MKFILLFYTDGWEVGPSVELSYIPAPGSVVWTAGRRRDEDGDMYYVDNVMYPEGGIERDDSIYLYVRPYNGYTRYAPLTEADRIAGKLARLVEVMESIAVVLRKLSADNAAIVEGAAALREEVESIRTGTAAPLGEIADAAGRLVGFADAIEDGQQAQSERLDDMMAALEELKGRL